MTQVSRANSDKTSRTYSMNQEDSMFLQGNLQAVFDALYSIGAIDPVLKMDWQEITKDMMGNPQILHNAFMEINECAGDKEMLVKRLETMDIRSVHYIAMEVAREFCEFQDRADLH